LLAEDVFPGPGRAHDRVRVQVVRQTDVDRVDAAVGEQSVQIAMHARLAAGVLVGKRLGAGLRYVGDGGDRAARRVAGPRAGVDLAHPARADDTGADGVSRGLLSAGAGGASRGASGATGGLARG